MMNYFDPREYIKGLQQIFISDTKRIGFLCGAGTSFSIKRGASLMSSVPLVATMTKKIIDDISTDSKTKQYKTPIEKIINELEDNSQNPNIEHILSNITQKHSIIGKEKLCGLDKKGWGELRELIEIKIKDLVSVHKNKSDYISDFLHNDLALWIKNAARKEAIEIFTTNYDYLFEIGLEKNNVPYFDGFVGSYYPFFFPGSVDDMSFLNSITKLWKLHGSLGWSYDEESRGITRTLPDDSNIMVYPSFLKYDNSKKQPYVSFMDRLSNFIKKDDGVLFVCGYSFGDFHINDLLTTALEKANTSHIVVFYYDEYKREDEIFYSLNEDIEIRRIAESNKKISVYGMSSAIIGGKYGRWKIKNKITEDEDAVLLDLFFEDFYSEEGFLAKNAFIRIENVDFDLSKKIWSFLNDSKIIDKTGIYAKDYEDTIKELKFPEQFQVYEDDILEVIRLHKSWNGEGVFKLADFAHFVNLLQNLNSEDYIKKIGKSNESK
jgi:SIR2-like domain